MNDPTALFPLLADVLRKHGAHFAIKADEPGNLYIETPAAKPGGKPGFFGAVQAKKAYVAYHLMPIYENPGLLTGISDALRKKMHGKSCFRFTAVDTRLFEELDVLTATCAAAVR